MCNRGRRQNNQFDCERLANIFEFKKSGLQESIHEGDCKAYAYSIGASFAFDSIIKK